MGETHSYDVFISHASEDKDRFVRPLAEALRANDLAVWFDEWDLEVGDPLAERINEGLAQSRFGVVVLSPAFFAKKWPPAELQALAMLELNDGRERLLPVWLDVGSDDIAAVAPLLQPTTSGTPTVRYRSSPSNATAATTSSVATSTETSASR